MSEDKNLIEGHDYDGIQECDYPLPNWWLFTFLATIMFGYLYYLHYASDSGQTIADELKVDMALVETAQKAHRPAGDSEDELKKLLASAPALEEGKAVFISKCSACHGVELQGLIGPNLTDDFWIHGKGTLAGIATVIRQGVLDKGMPPWDGQLKDLEIKSVVAYVASRRGSNPKNAKAPQGEQIVGN